MAKLKKGVFEQRKKWFEDNAPKFNSMKEMTKAFNEYFGLNLKESGVVDYFYKRLKMKFERYVNFTKQQTEWIKKNYYKYPTKELTENFNDIFCVCFTEEQIYSKLSNMKLSYRQANNLPLGETHSKHKIGDILQRKDASCLVKITNGKGVKNYVYANRYFYEKYYGPIPEDCIVIQLDGDKNNFNKNNLCLLTRKQQGNVMTFGIKNDIKCFGQGKLTEAIVSVVKLETLVKEIEKEEGE